MVAAICGTNGFGIGRAGAPLTEVTSGRWRIADNDNDNDNAGSGTVSA